MKRRPKLTETSRNRRDERGALVVGQAQCPRQRAEQLGRGLAAAALLEAYDVVDRHAGEHGHLFPAQARRAAAGAVGDADLGRPDRLAAAAQEVGELVTLHDLILPRVRRASQGVAVP